MLNLGEVLWLRVVAAHCRARARRDSSNPWWIWAAFKGVKFECVLPIAGSVRIKRRGMSVKLIYRSEHYCIVDYPAHEAVELLDKQGFRSCFLSGAAARLFQQEMALAGSDPSQDAGLDALLSRYCVDAARPILFH